MFSYGDQPYGRMGGSEVYDYIKSRRRLDRPMKCPRNTYNKMLECWEWKEEMRPTFIQLNEFFQYDSDYQAIPTLKAYK
jgi:hypothetical protein